MYCIAVRIFNVDPVALYFEVKKILSEIKNIGELFEIFSEINDLKNFFIENIKEGIMESDIYEEHIVIEKLLNEFLLRCEEQVQFDLNALSSHVEGLEKTITIIPPNSEEEIIPPSIPPHTNKHSPE